MLHTNNKTLNVSHVVILMDSLVSFLYFIIQFRVAYMHKRNLECIRINAHTVYQGNIELTSIKEKRT